ncbi:Uu.00g058260.m01.CDS01 [Anthostomella pinea]|uniref:Uu.00g058260.m01.CDS01 n=1 Tax=Anthostomella pinea TaxID=933095 RepID=A0AAI8VRS2_9PEZI|nr:Uu.00g058260.m01.CDS01 [Anthostomella pinea]
MSTAYKCVAGHEHRSQNPVAGLALLAELDGVMNAFLDRRLNGTWSTYGGFVDREETNRQAAFRKTREETGLIDDDLIYIEWQATNEHGNGFRYTCLCDSLRQKKNRQGHRQLSSESPGAGWYPINDLPRPLHPWFEEWSGNLVQMATAAQHHPDLYREVNGKPQQFLASQQQFTECQKKLAASRQQFRESQQNLTATQQQFRESQQNLTATQNLTASKQQLVDSQHSEARANARIANAQGQKPTKPSGQLPPNTYISPSPTGSPTQSSPESPDQIFLSPPQTTSQTPSQSPPQSPLMQQLTKQFKGMQVTDVTPQTMQQLIQRLQALQIADVTPEVLGHVVQHIEALRTTNNVPQNHPTQDALMQELVDRLQRMQLEGVTAADLEWLNTRFAAMQINGAARQGQAPQATGIPPQAPAPAGPGLSQNPCTVPRPISITRSSTVSCPLAGPEPEPEQTRHLRKVRKVRRQLLHSPN